MKKVILIRHVTTIFNELEIIQGQKDSPISSKGKSDINFLANHLKRYFFDKLFSSDLERAFTTAKLISKKNGLTTNIITDSLLREVDHGKYSEVLKKNKNRLHKDFKTTLHFVPPNGESYATMIKRIKKL